MTFFKYRTIFIFCLSSIYFLLLRFVFAKIQKFAWKLNGTMKKIEDSKKPDNYHRCAQVLDVLLSRFLFGPGNLSLNNFICRHNRFESIDYIFENDHVTLITLDNDYAIFGEAKEKGMHLWKMEYGSVLCYAQEKFCKRLILVPLEHFHRMAEELGDPKAKLVFIYSTGRCGSTLITQMMEFTDQCVSLSEPRSLHRLCVWQENNKKTEEHLRQLYRDCVRWICRPHKDFHPTVYLLKMAPSFLSPLLLLSGVFPDAKNLFMYRNVMDVLKSYNKISINARHLLTLNHLPKFLYRFRDRLMQEMGFQPPDKKYSESWNLYSFQMLNYARSCQQYLQLRKEGRKISAFRYEDLMADPEYSLGRIFEYCQLPKSMIDKALRGLSLDSQRNSIFSQEALKKYTSAEFTADLKTYCDSILKMFSLPTMEEECLLDGTITLKT